MNLSDLPRPGWIHQFIKELKTPQSTKEWLTLLHRVAYENVLQGGGPFAAAALRKDGSCIDLNVNQVVETNDPTAHAEQMVLRNCIQSFRSENRSALQLAGVTILSSAEPCVGCQGALYLSVPDKVIWSLSTKEVESHSRFDEGPKDPTFWSQALARRKIKSESGEAVNEEALRPFIEFTRRLQTGESTGYCEEQL